jgi:hypothetical protein
MDSKNGKTNNIYFPLCFLSYREHEIIYGEDEEYIPTLPEIADYILDYGIVEYAMKLQRDEFFISDNDMSEVKKIGKEKRIMISSKLNKYIILSCLKLEIDLGNIENSKRSHAKLSLYLQEYEARHGKDAKVKIHKDILFEVRDKKFDERLFRIYCAVLSVIGNKNFVRITIKNISYRMHGYKTSDIYLMSDPSYEVLTHRQIKTALDKLQQRSLIHCNTYGKRQTFYSVKLKDERLLNVIAEKKSNEKFRKSKTKKANEMLDLKVKEKHLKLLMEYEKTLKNEGVKKMLSDMIDQ